MFRAPHDSRRRGASPPTHPRRHLPSPIDARLQIHPMKNATQDDHPPALLIGPVLGTLPADLFQQEVLRRLGPTDLASLAGAGRGCAAAVAATALMRWANRTKNAAASSGIYIPPLCLKEACHTPLVAGTGRCWSGCTTPAARGMF